MASIDVTDRARWQELAGAIASAPPSARRDVITSHVLDWGIGDLVGFVAASVGGFDMCQKAGNPGQLVLPVPESRMAEVTTLAVTLVRWGECDPDLDFFQGDVVSLVLEDCGRAGRLLSDLVGLSYDQAMCGPGDTDGT